jgi:hypothetical protein
MKIRNLLVLTIAFGLGALSAQSQEPNGSMTFKDNLGQSITISHFGTVLSFRNSEAKEIVTNHDYRVCPCGKKDRCIDSTAPVDGTTAGLKAEFPKQGATLKKGQTLIITATVHLDAMTLRRRLAWMAGSSVVEIIETISASLTAICGLDENAKVPLGKMCPGPPGRTALKCPAAELKQPVCAVDCQLLRKVSMDLSKFL